MFFKKTAFLAIVLLMHFVIFSQPQKLFWAPPTKQDLQMKHYKDDTSIAAMVLEKYADVYFDDWREELRLIYKVRKRIKIFTPEGKKYASLRVPYIGYDYFEDFAETKGYIYRLVNGKVMRKRLKKKNITKKQLSKYIYVLEINFPDVQPGDIVEIQYTLATFKFMQPRRWYFQEDIPVRYSEFNANIPYFMKYYFSIYGADLLDEKKVEDAYANIEWSARYTDPIPSGMYYHGYNFRANPNLTFHSIYYHFVMKDVPPFYKEPFIDNPKQYYYHLDMNLYRLEREIGYSSPSVRFLWELFSKRLYQTTQLGYTPMTKERSQNSIYPPGYIIFDASNWELLAKYLRKDPAFGIFLKKTADIIPIVNELKSKNNQADSLQMIKAVYKWVNTNIRWNGEYNFLASDRLKNILRNKQGASADINLTLIAILRYLGFDANPVIIRTVDRGHLIIDLAAFYQFNHVLAAVKINGKTILLDAIGKNKPWFILDKNDMNQVGFLIKADTSYFVNIFHPIKSTQNLILQLKQSENSAVGQIELRRQGLFRLDSSNIQALITKATIGNKTLSQNNETTIIEKYEIEIPQFISETDSTLIIYPFKIFTEIKNIFPFYSRSLPIYLGHRLTKQYHIELSVNEEIIKEDLPIINRSLNGINYKLITQVKGKNQVVIDLQLNMDRYYFDASEFPQLYEFWDNYENLRHSKIILHKGK